MSIFSNSLISAGLQSSITRNPMQDSLISEGLRNSSTRNPMKDSLVSAGLKSSIFNTGLNNKFNALDSIYTQEQNNSNNNYLASLSEAEKKLKKLFESDVFKTLLQNYIS